jgi:signal transduction histidine kinase
VLTLAALGGFTVMAAAGWLLVLEAEDAILEALVAESVQAQERPEGSPARPQWLTYVQDDAALCRRTGLAAAPDTPGPHELFASADGSASVLIAGIADRWRVWLASDREREFRLRRDRAGRGWWLADLSYFEFTEERVASVRTSILAASVGVGLLALLLGGLIVRWTVRPVVALAARVQAGTRLVGAPARPLADGCADDEVGFLARALDESRSRVAESLARERQFIAECSHELRTPLAVLKAAAALLPEVAEEPEGRARALGLEQAGAVVEVGPPRPGEPYTDGERWWTLTPAGQVQGLLCPPVRGPAPAGARMGAWEVDVEGGGEDVSE